MLTPSRRNTELPTMASPVADRGCGRRPHGVRTSSYTICLHPGLCRRSLQAGRPAADVPPAHTRLAAVKLRPGYLKPGRWALAVPPPALAKPATTAPRPIRSSRARGPHQEPALAEQRVGPVML